MFEMKITITVPDLAEAIKDLAAALIFSKDSITKGNVCEEDSYKKHTVETQKVNNDLSTSPEVQPSAAEPPAAHVVPTSAPKYTLDMIAKAGTALIDTGKINELTALLAKYGVDALTSLNPDYYGTFASELRALGAQI